MNRGAHESVKDQSTEGFFFPVLERYAIFECSAGFRAVYTSLYESKVM